MIKHGDIGQKVSEIQQALVSAGFPVLVDGHFGDKTEKAVIRFQKARGLFADGIVGSATLSALFPRAIDRNTGKYLTEQDMKAAAKELGVQIAAIRAVTEVESRESGFLESGRPVILFERHIMYRRLFERAPEYAVHTNLVNEKPGGYEGGESEWRRFMRACEIDRNCAIESTSWGLFQIMGFHWRHLGYQSAENFFESMHHSEGEQLAAFVRFIKAAPPLHQALKNRDWQQFARLYNGPAYARNRYDLKLADAYDRHRQIGRVA